MEHSNSIQISPEILKLKPEERIERMTPLLLAWFQKNARILPWRTEPRPYYVWVSEIMLQQTRVEAVKPYFNRFIMTLPNIRALAECEEEQLLKLWEGLGYYNRARNLQKAAKVVMEKYQGELPADYEALLKLPGIGSYTAGAIASIAYQIPVPAVDGNVLRVMARLTESYEDIAKASVKKQTEELLKKHMPKKAASAFNQAMMEIGAIVCLPNGEPKCKECPIRSFCLANARQVVTELPVKEKKKARRIEEMTVFVIHSGQEWESSNQIVLRRRPESGLLAGLYEFPNVPGKLDIESAKAVLEEWGIKVQSILPIEEAKHVFSHVEWHMKGYLVQDKSAKSNSKIAEHMIYRINRSENRLEWLGIDKIQSELAIPSAFSAYTKYMEKILH